MSADEIDIQTACGEQQIFKGGHFLKAVISAKYPVMKRKQAR